MRHNIPIFLASNDKYAPLVATTIASVCYNTKSFCEFYVLDSGISNLNKKRIGLLKEKFNNFSIEYIKVDFDKFKNFNINGYFSLDVYSRFLIPFLKSNIDKAIYSDVDVSFVGDVAELYNENLDDKAVGACQEIYVTEKIEELKIDLGLTKNHKYFYAGMLLIDCKKWRENNTIDELFKIEKKYRSKLKFFDQDILNIYFNDNNYKKLSIKYCLTNKEIEFKDKLDAKHREEAEEAIKNPVIRHFESSNKPWLTNKNIYGTNIKDFDVFWFFAKMTSFYDNLLLNYQNNRDNFNKKYIKLFNLFTLLSVKKENNCLVYKLFDFIPILKVIKK